MTPAAAPVCLIADRISIERGGRTILRDVSFRVAAGEMLLLTGPNGAGKTSLIRAVAGFLRVSAGRFQLDGGDDERDIAQHCHYVGHQNAMKATLTVREGLAFWADFLGGGSADVDRAIEVFRLDALADVPAGYLSAGQKRRAGLARLLTAQRPIWLLDEPTASLDTANSDVLSAAVIAHCTAGGLAIAATHLPLGLERARELRLSGRPTGPAEAGDDAVSLQ